MLVVACLGGTLTRQRFALADKMAEIVIDRESSSSSDNDNGDKDNDIENDIGDTFIKD